MGNRRSQAADQGGAQARAGRQDQLGRNGIEAVQSAYRQDGQIQAGGRAVLFRQSETRGKTGAHGAQTHGGQAQAEACEEGQREKICPCGGPAGGGERDQDNLPLKSW